jgi:hypothetical protein
MNRRVVLILGDIISLAVITLIGFANHNELTAFPVNRMLARFIPLLVGWFLIAPWLGGSSGSYAREQHH